MHQRASSAILSRYLCSPDIALRYPGENIAPGSSFAYCFSIAISVRHSPRRDKTGMRQSGHDRRRNGLRLDAPGIAGIADDPDPGFEAFDRERAVMGQTMLDLEARAAAADHRGLDRDLVAEPGRQPKARPGLDQRVAGKIVSLQVFDLLHAESALDQHRGRDVEHVEIAGKENDAGRVAVAPFNPGFAGAGKHEPSIR